ncbi:MAG: efflux transporter outer membrane subunit [Acidobacteria bacterium]|nr:efflux transporter outer membrane subunit [Acidobacteriota bacterium]
MRKLALVPLMGILLTGCLMGPDYQRPPVTTPEQYYIAQGVAEAKSLADLPWWEVFDDPLLKSLVDEALENGFDARIAAARVEESRARYGIEKSAYYPQLDYRLGVDRNKLPDIDGNDTQARTLYTANVGLSWEIDLWGRIRRLNEAAKAQYLASEDAQRGVLLSLTSDVATAYFQLRELDVELEIAKRTTLAFQDTYDLFSRRLEGGAASALETSRAEANLRSVAAQIPELERAIVAKENQINFLLGRNPQAIVRDEPMTPLPPPIPAGLPSQLLERRPDVRQAEDEMIAANANIGAAKADFFPTLSLTGIFGYASHDLNDLVSTGNFYTFGAGLLGPLFQGGRLKRQYEAVKWQWEQAKIRYEATVANAFGEVSTFLTDRMKLETTVEQRALAVVSYQEAVRVANLRYLSGLSSYFEVLEAEQQLFPAENLLAQSRRDQFLAVVNLYRALGGGWQVEERNGLPGEEAPATADRPASTPPPAK